MGMRSLLWRGACFVWRTVWGVVNSWLVAMIILATVAVGYKFRDRLQALWERFTN